MPPARRSSKLISFQSFSPLNAGPWPEPVSKVIILPLLGGGLSPLGWLVAGTSPRRPLDESYRDFFRLVAAHTASAVTAARALEEERERSRKLAELDKAKTVFFSNVSRTPLTLMLAPLEEMLLASDDGAPRDKQQQLATIAHRNALRLQKLVNGLLDFSRIEAGRMQARYEPTDLPALTAELASNFRSAIEAAGLKLVVDCPALPEPINQLAPGSYVRISVEDTGCGMDEAVAARAIEPFFTTKGIGKGTGLGLSMVHGLASQLGGTLTIRSRKGRGTKIELWLPVSADEVQRTESQGNEERVRLAAGTVLLVDDEDIVRVTAVDMLAELGFRVLQAELGERALQMLDNGLLIDLLITDHLMSGMTGVQLAHAVRERWPAIRVLVMPKRTDWHRIYRG